MPLMIKGLEKTSLIDYPGRMCSIIFLPKCDFRCPYCQNPDLVLNWEDLPDFSEENVLKMLKERKKWVDGVTFTGGEPCLHKELPDFTSKVKDLGFLVKLDTNGTKPEMIDKMIKQGLVDYIAMDIKGPIQKYERIARVKVNRERIRRSVYLIRKSGLEYEFRTTFVPNLITERDVKDIGRWLTGSRLYVIQQFRPFITLDRNFGKVKPYSREQLEMFARVLEPHFDKVIIRD